MNEKITHLIVGSDWVDHSEVDKDINNYSNNSISISEKMVMVWSLSKFTLGLRVYYLATKGKYLKLEFNHIDPIIKTLPNNILEYNTLGSALAYIIGLMGRIRSTTSRSNIDGLERLDEYVKEFAKLLESGRSTFNCKLSQISRNPKLIMDSSSVT